MAVGDWPAGAYIAILRGYLNLLDSGQAGVADVDYNVVLPSGAVTFNGGVAGFTPFHFVADATLSIAGQGMALVAALAAREGLEVRLTGGQIVRPLSSRNYLSFALSGTLTV